MSEDQREREFHDKCAIAAMQGELAYRGSCALSDPDIHASWAFNTADAMLAERRKREKKKA